jgi:hypothetical protein
MYTVSVPLVSQTLYRTDQEALALQLKNAGVGRVFLSIGTYIADPEKRRTCMEQLRENCAFFRAEGFEVGIWLWTIQFPEENSFSKITSVYGDVRQHEACPADPEFREFAANYIKELAGLHPDVILFDDDYRLTVHNRDLACACQQHLALTGHILGRPVTRQEIAAAMIGAPNPLRSAFQQAKRESLLQFARQMRQALDSVDPTIRLGLCAGMAAWDADGIDAPTLSRVLAGSTKPLLRLIAAPYWIPMKLWNNRLQDVIELSRLERSWCGEGIEILAEGDTYPRPRFSCPASYLEGFDTAMRADGTVNGILKYMVDYCSSSAYEPGYLAFHQRNQGLYDQLARDFAPKAAAGIRVYETMQKLERQTLPEETDGPKNCHRYLFSYAARMLAANGIPTTYEGTGCAGICFGENAKYLPAEALEKGLILDRQAAVLLQERGIDTGILRELGDFSPTEEYFPDCCQYALADGKTAALALKPGAQVLSWYTRKDAKTPGSYFYENARGQRFLVLCFDGCFCKESLFRQYTRARQVQQILPRLSGEMLPASCPGNPDLYLMCKEGQDEMAVGLWNFSADPILQPRVLLSKTYDSIRFLNCSGCLDGDTAVLSELPPFGFCGFVVK